MNSALLTHCKARPKCSLPLRALFSWHCEAKNFFLFGGFIELAGHLGNLHQVSVISELYRLKLPPVLGTGKAAPLGLSSVLGPSQKERH